METKDNGKFFVHDVLLAKGTKHFGGGGTRERMVSGVFEIESSPDQGALVSMEIPVPRVAGPRVVK